MNQIEIKDAIERNVKAVTLRPSIGQNTAVTRVRLTGGLRCDIEEGNWKMAAGMSPKYGGDGLAPSPGVLGRGALGSCLAVGYAMWAARLGVELTSLEVEVQADYDVRGELGASPDVRPGYLAIRCVVSVSSPAPEADVMKVLDTADRYSSWLDNIANPVRVTREVRLLAGERR